MRIITLNDVGFTWRKPALLDNLSLAIDSGEHIGLLGRNGTGKSTLMKLISGELIPDHGEIRREPKLKVARLVQEVSQTATGSVREIVEQGIERGTAEEAHDASHWQAEAAIHKTLSRMQLDEDWRFENLSAGMKRRVLLAQALVGAPDLLLLDEPTNHLDIESILWLENFLKGYEGALLFVTHDRVFLQSLASRIWEIDRGRLFDWECNYDKFLERKAEVLAAEEKQEALFDKRLAEEEAWIRTGIKARRTRNEGRVRALEEMRRQRASRRDQVGNVRVQAVEQERSGQMVIELKQVSFSYGERTIVGNLTTTIMRGDKIGIVGPNGAGKSTLLKLLLGQLKPTEGSVRLGTKLEILYFDQLREQIDDEKTIADNIADGKDKLVINGKERHVLSYLQDFLFTPDRSRQLAKFLSGGERNRLLLARLFKNPSNVLVLDEPTNDLDTETLELLEELVGAYQGTLLLVSHDRAFLNNVVTSIIALEGTGEVVELGGGYDDYRRYKDRQASQAQSSGTPGKGSSKKKGMSSITAEAPPPAAASKGKLSFKEQKELAGLPSKIADTEKGIEELHVVMANGDFYKQSPEKIKEVSDKLSRLEADLAGFYARWEELEGR